MFNRLDEENPNEFSNDQNMNLETTSTTSSCQVIRNNSIINVDATLMELFELNCRSKKFLKRISCFGLLDLVLITFAISFQLIVLGHEREICLIRRFIVLFLFWVIIGPFIGSFLINLKKEKVCELNVIDGVRVLEFFSKNHTSNYYSLNRCTQNRTVRVKYNVLSNLYHEFIQ